MSFAVRITPEEYEKIIVEEQGLGHLKPHRLQIKTTTNFTYSVMEGKLLEGFNRGGNVICILDYHFACGGVQTRMSQSKSYQRS